MAAPTTLAAVGQAVGASESDMLEYSEADMSELLKDELGMGVVARNKVLKEWRATKAKSVVVTVQARFAAFLERMGVGGSQALQGLEKVPLSTLWEAVSFIKGAPGAPSDAELQLGVRRAYAKIDTLLVQGPDNWSLSRDEMAAIHFYTDDGLGGPAGSLFRPLNAALRGCERADAKPYWGYIRLLQHALFKLPKDKSGVLYRGIKWNWPGAPPLHQLKADFQRLAASGEVTPQEHEIWWGFSSTSTSMGAVESFLGQAGPRVIFTIDGGSSARDVRRYSAFQAGQPVPEDERLLPCGTAFAVKTVGSPAPNLLLVGLRQTNDILIQGGAAAAAPIPEGVPGVEPEPEAGAAQTTAAQLQMAAQKAALDAQLKAQQDAASVALAQQLQRQEAEAAQAEARHADAHGVCRLLAAPGVDAPLATVCCQRVVEISDGGPGKLAAEGTTFIAAGGCQALVAAMRSHIAVANLQAQACHALRNLSRSDEGEAAVRAAGGAEANNLTNKGAEGAAAVLAAGGAEAVVGALRAHVGVAAVQEEGCAAANNLTNKGAEGAAAVLAAGGAEAVVGALRAHVGVAAVQERGCRAARNLAANSAEGRAALRRLGAVELAQAAKRNHPTHGGVQKMSDGLLRKL